MSRVIKSNQVKISEEKLITSTLKPDVLDLYSNENNQTHSQLSKEVDELIKLKDKLSREIEEMKNSAHVQKNEIISNANTEYERIINEAKSKATAIFETQKQKGYEEGYNSSLLEYKHLINEALDIKKLFWIGKVGKLIA
ncbi:FliH/SctL family protein [Alkalithermobacter paradoxus]|uniref:Flagellar assembly protein H n=1 Tax=Alkalithermobacter paradoxus TaxID=29349 RepID=A0A1V4IBS8_9FIRM|nr:hypothetical protein CLOTH_03680 [[Clostridium] thermoalcaliphilum]